MIAIGFTTGSWTGPDPWVPITFCMWRRLRLECYRHGPRELPMVTRRSMPRIIACAGETITLDFTLEVDRA